MFSVVELCGTGDRTLPGLRPLRSRGRTPESARTAPYPRSSGLAAYGSPSSSSSFSSPSNGSLNCTGSLYGASLASGLGGCGRGFLATSRSVGQPLADDAPHRILDALFIVDAERHPVVVPKIELREIALQMPLVAVLVHANHAAVEHREEAFDGVG